MQDILVFIHEHWTLSLVLVIALTLLMLIEFIKQKQAASRLSSAEATRFINQKNAVVVDVRSPEAFAKGHIINSISLPLKDLPEKYKKIEKFKSQPIIITCATGADSQRAAALLKTQGFTVYVLLNGLNGWRAADMPLTKN